MDIDTATQTENLVLSFGKYKTRLISDVFEIDPKYCLWLLNQPSIKAHNDIYRYLKSKIHNRNEIYLTFGKHKNKSLTWIIQNDNKYINYLKNNNFVQTHLKDLAEAVNKI